jgi:hypothetical protein
LPVDQLGPEESVVGVELKQQLAGRALWRGIGWPEANGHRAILTGRVTGEVHRIAHERGSATPSGFGEFDIA